MLKRWLLALVLFLGLAAAVLLSEAPTGSITGVVTDPLGQGVKASSAQVIAYGPVVRGVYLGQDGHYILDRLPQGQYRVRVSAPGYQSVEVAADVAVQEGSVQALPKTRLERLPPRLNLYGTSQVFTTEEQGRVNLRASGVVTVDIDIYRYTIQNFLTSPDLEALVDGYGYNYMDSEIFKQSDLVESWTQPIQVEGDDDWATVTLELPSLAPGSYWITATGIGAEPNLRREASFGFQVTDLGIVQKVAADRVAVQAINLRTLEPLAAVEVEWFVAGDRLGSLVTRTTDVDGLAILDLPQTDVTPNWILYAHSSDPQFEALSGVYYYGAQEDQRFYTYTDRPLYRPGQTVYYRSIIRQMNPEQGPQILAPGSSVEVEISQPNGDPLLAETVTMGEFGTVHGSFQIPVEGELGSYRIALTSPEGTQRYHSVQVEEYRKPEFSVTVTPEQPWVVQGDSVAVEARAEYLFGGPVAQAQVHYIVYRSADWGFQYSVLPRSPQEVFFAQYQGSDREYGYYGGYGDVVFEGDAITDSGGTARIQLDRVLQDYDWDRGDDYYGSASVQQLRVEVDVTDISRRSVTQDGRVRVTQGTVALFGSPDRYAVSPGQSVTYRLQSYGYDQDPVAFNGTLYLEKWHYRSSSSSYVLDEVVATQPFRTGSDGQGSVQLAVPSELPTGSYRVLIKGRDQAGHEVTETLPHLWVMNVDQPWDPAEQGAVGVSVVADQSIYEVGDTAELVVTSPLPDAVALVTVEGATLFEAKVHRFDGQLAVLEVPIVASYRPNAEFVVTIVGADRQVYQGSVELLVSPLDRFLQVNLSSNQEVYQPGETAAITVQTLGSDGSPVSAEVSLGMVDEAIYILRADTTSDIRHFFYRRQYNQVRTVYSFPQQYPGGPNKLANNSRRDFRDTALWIPDIVTNEQGLATVDVLLPDNLTTWRLTARATTTDTQVGSSVDTIQVTKDLLVRLATPRFFRTGDETVIAAVVQNQTDQSQRVRVQLDRPSSIQLLNPNREIRQVVVPAQSARRVDWPVRIRDAGETTVRVTAVGETEQDGMQLTIPIQPYGSDERLTRQGSLTASNSEKALIDLEMPAEVVPGSIDLSLQLASSSAADLLGALDYLAGYPYGCTEQTLSRFIPTLAVQQALDTLGIQLQTSTLNALPDYVNAGIRRLLTFQNGDGGWGWWQRDASNPDLTSYVMVGLYRADVAGYDVKIDQIERGLAFLEDWLAQESLQGRGTDSQLFAQYALSLYGRGQLEAVRTVNPQSLSTFGLAYQALALVKMGDQQTAQSVFNRAMEWIMANPGSRWYWEAEDQEDRRYAWQRGYYSDVEVAGPLLQVASALQDPRAVTLAESVLNLREGQRWHTTKASADGILGLVAFYERQSARQGAPNYQVRVVNRTTGSLLGRWQPTAEEPYFTVHLTPTDLGSGLLQPGFQLIEIDKQGSGPLYYSLTTQVVAPATAEDTIGDVNQGFNVEREYVTLTPKPESDGSITYLERPLTGSVPAGEMVLGRVTVTADRDRHYVMVEEPLPSGAEIASQDPGELRGSDRRSPYWWDWFWTQQTIRDDRITFFMTQFPQGSREFVYLFRPEIPGEFSVPPTVVEEMYDPAGVYGLSQSGSLHVDDSTR